MIVDFIAHARKATGEKEPKLFERFWSTLKRQEMRKVLVPYGPLNPNWEGETDAEQTQEIVSHSNAHHDAKTSRSAASNQLNAWPRPAVAVRMAKSLKILAERSGVAVIGWHAEDAFYLDLVGHVISGLASTCATRVGVSPFPK